MIVSDTENDSDLLFGFLIGFEGGYALHMCASYALTGNFLEDHTVRKVTDFLYLIVFTENCVGVLQIAFKGGAQGVFGVVFTQIITAGRE